MKNARKKSATAERTVDKKPSATDAKPLDTDKIASLLTPCLIHSSAHSASLSDSEIESLLSLGKELTKPLLETLSKCCADIYEIRDYMWELLDDERYQECHHVLMLLYCACRESMSGCLALLACACFEDMLVPYMWGVMSAFENYIDEQDELYRREESHGK